MGDSGLGNRGLRVKYGTIFMKGERKPLLLLAAGILPGVQEMNGNETLNIVSQSTNQWREAKKIWRHLLDSSSNWNSGPFHHYLIRETGNILTQKSSQKYCHSTKEDRNQIWQCNPSHYLETTGCERNTASHFIPTGGLITPFSLSRSPSLFLPLFVVKNQKEKQWRRWKRPETNAARRDTIALTERAHHQIRLLRVKLALNSTNSCKESITFID